MSNNTAYTRSAARFAIQAFVVIAAAVIGAAVYLSRPDSGLLLPALVVVVLVALFGATLNRSKSG